MGTELLTRRMDLIHSSDNSINTLTMDTSYPVRLSGIVVKVFKATSSYSYIDPDTQEEFSDSTNLFFVRNQAGASVVTIQKQNVYTFSGKKLKNNDYVIGDYVLSIIDINNSKIFIHSLKNAQRDQDDPIYTKDLDYHCNGVNDNVVLGDIVNIMMDLYDDVNSVDIDGDEFTYKISGHDRSIIFNGDAFTINIIGKFGIDFSKTDFTYGGYNRQNRSSIMTIAGKLGTDRNVNNITEDRRMGMILDWKRCYIPDIVPSNETMSAMYNMKLNHYDDNNDIIYYDYWTKTNTPHFVDAEGNAYGNLFPRRLVFMSIEGHLPVDVTIKNMNITSFSTPIYIEGETYIDTDYKTVNVSNCNFTINALGTSSYIKINGVEIDGVMQCGDITNNQEFYKYYKNLCNVVSPAIDINSVYTYTNIDKCTFKGTELSSGVINSSHNTRISSCKFLCKSSVGVYLDYEYSPLCKYESYSYYISNCINGNENETASFTSTQLQRPNDIELTIFANCYCNADMYCNISNNKKICSIDSSTSDIINLYSITPNTNLIIDRYNIIDKGDRDGTISPKMAINNANIINVPSMFTNNYAQLPALLPYMPNDCDKFSTMSEFNNTLVGTRRRLNPINTYNEFNTETLFEPIMNIQNTKFNSIECIYIEGGKVIINNSAIEKKQSLHAHTGYNRKQIVVANGSLSISNSTCELDDRRELDYVYTDTIHEYYVASNQVRSIIDVYPIICENATPSTSNISKDYYSIGYPAVRLLNRPILNIDSCKFTIFPNKSVNTPRIMDETGDNTLLYRKESSTSLNLLNVDDHDIVNMNGAASFGGYTSYLYPNVLTVPPTTDRYVCSFISCNDSNYSSKYFNKNLSPVININNSDFSVMNTFNGNEYSSITNDSSNSGSFEDDDQKSYTNSSLCVKAYIGDENIEMINELEFDTTPVQTSNGYGIKLLKDPISLLNHNTTKPSNLDAKITNYINILKVELNEKTYNDRELYIAVDLDTIIPGADLDGYPYDYYIKSKFIEYDGEGNVTLYGEGYTPINNTDSTYTRIQKSRLLSVYSFVTKLAYLGGLLDIDDPDLVSDLFCEQFVFINRIRPCDLISTGNYMDAKKELQKNEEKNKNLDMFGVVGFDLENCIFNLDNSNIGICMDNYISDTYNAETLLRRSPRICFSFRKNGIYNINNSRASAWANVLYSSLEGYNLKNTISLDNKDIYSTADISTLDLTKGYIKLNNSSLINSNGVRYANDNQDFINKMLTIPDSTITRSDGVSWNGECNDYISDININNILINGNEIPIIYINNDMSNYVNIYNTDILGNQIYLNKGRLDISNCNLTNNNNGLILECRDISTAISASQVSNYPAEVILKDNNIVSTKDVIHDLYIDSVRMKDYYSNKPYILDLSMRGNNGFVNMRDFIDAGVVDDFSKQTNLICLLLCNNSKVVGNKILFRQNSYDKTKGINTRTSIRLIDFVTKYLGDYNIQINDNDMTMCFDSMAFSSTTKILPNSNDISCIHIPEYDPEYTNFDSSLTNRCINICNNKFDICNVMTEGAKYGYIHGLSYTSKSRADELIVKQKLLNKDLQVYGYSGNTLSTDVKYTINPSNKVCNLNNENIDLDDYPVGSVLYNKPINCTVSNLLTNVSMNSDNSITIGNNTYYKLDTQGTRLLKLDSTGCLTFSLYNFRTPALFVDNSKCSCINFNNNIINTNSTSSYSNSAGMSDIINVLRSNVVADIPMLEAYDSDNSNRTYNFNNNTISNLKPNTMYYKLNMSQTPFNSDLSQIGNYDVFIIKDSDSTTLKIEDTNSIANASTTVYNIDVLDQLKLDSVEVNNTDYNSKSSIDALTSYIDGNIIVTSSENEEEENSNITICYDDSISMINMYQDPTIEDLEKQINHYSNYNTGKYLKLFSNTLVNTKNNSAINTGDTVYKEPIKPLLQYILSDLYYI